MNKDEFVKTFLKISLHRMVDFYFVKLKETFRVIDKEILWSQPYPSSNSIGGIVLHVTEHVQRTCYRLTGQDHLLKSGIENYFPNTDLSPMEVLNQFDQQLIEWKVIMREYIRNERHIETENIHYIYHLIEHAGYHLGQVIDRIQGQTGNKFEFCKNGLNERYLRDKIEEEED